MVHNWVPERHRVVFFSFPKLIGFGAMEVTKPYNFIGFGAMDVTKPYKFIGFGGWWTGDIHGPKSYNF